jgi:hypothetical protein
MPHGVGKPVGINEYIGRRPIAAFGNSEEPQRRGPDMGG